MKREKPSSESGNVQLQKSLDVEVVVLYSFFDSPCGVRNFWCRFPGLQASALHKEDVVAKVAKAISLQSGISWSHNMQRETAENNPELK